MPPGRAVSGIENPDSATESVKELQADIRRPRKLVRDNCRGIERIRVGRPQREIPRLVARTGLDGRSDIGQVRPVVVAVSPRSVVVQGEEAADGASVHEREKSQAAGPVCVNRE